MTIVGGMSLVRQELTEIHLFFFFTPIQAILQHSTPRTKNIFKFKTQGGGRKRKGRRGLSQLIGLRHVNNEAETQTVHGNDQKLK